MRNMASYTLAPWKVLWPEVGHTVRAGVCGPRPRDVNITAIPDHTIIAVPCDSGDEAFFVSALLNSAPAQAAIIGYVVLHPSPHILEHIAIPQFSAANASHARLAALAEHCHAEAAGPNTSKVSALERELDRAAAKFWGISNQQLKAIQNALAQIGKGPLV